MVLALVRRQTRALQERPGLIDVDQFDLPPFGEIPDDAEGRAPAGGCERTGVAVRDHPQRAAVAMGQDPVRPST